MSKTSQALVTLSLCVPLLAGAVLEDRGEYVEVTTGTKLCDPGEDVYGYYLIEGRMKPDKTQDVTYYRFGALLDLKTGLQQRIQFHVREAGQTGYAPASFDVVLGYKILHHIHDQLDTVFAEVARLLRPGGAAYFVEPVTNSAFLHAARSLARLPKFLENHLLIFLPDADTGIADRDTDQIAIHRGLNSHCSAFRSELQCIAKEVIKDLLEANAIRVNGRVLS